MPGNCSFSQNLQHSPPGPRFPLQPFTSTPPWPVRPGLLRSARLPGRCLFGFPLQSLSQAVAASAETFPGREAGNQKPRHWPKTPGVNLLPTKKSLKIPGIPQNPLDFFLHPTKKPPEIPFPPNAFETTQRGTTPNLPEFLKIRWTFSCHPTKKPPEIPFSPIPFGTTGYPNKPSRIPENHWITPQTFRNSSKSVGLFPALLYNKC